MKLSTLSATGLAVALAGTMIVASPGQTPAKAPAGKAPTAHADIKGEGITGSVTLTERKQGSGVVVAYVINVKGLKPGQHGVHLHAVGKCDPDFAAAGGHFDPGPAGNPDPDANHPFHMGDLANLVADTTGKGTLKITTSRVTLGDGPLSVFDPDGTAIIIHANPDQGVTGQPKSGVSGGPRVACGVITK